LFDNIAEPQRLLRRDGDGRTRTRRGGTEGIPRNNGSGGRTRPARATVRSASADASRGWARIDRLAGALGASVRPAIADEKATRRRGDSRELWDVGVDGDIGPVEGRGRIGWIGSGFHL